MRPAQLFLCMLLLVSVASLSLASVRSVQIYGIVERVIVEPNERTPERIKVYGAFAFLYTNQDPVSNGADPYAPRKGYLYFKLPQAAPGDAQNLSQTTAKREWVDLKAVAGTGQAVVFGAWNSGYWGLAKDSLSKNGFVSAVDSRDALRVNSEKDRGVDPIPYTMDTGIVKLANQGRFVVLITQLRETLNR